LIFDEETVQEVLKKLERYYDQKLTMEGPDISVKFSGKLNLDENLEEVLENISYSIPLALTKKQNEIIIKIKT
jgi:ferric-dicitrate binding protein FerR (iron transport regulator)